MRSTNERPRLWQLLSGPLVGLLGALCGCADILGYSDIQFDTTGSGATGGAGGTGGTGGVAGTGGTAGAGGGDGTCQTDADCAGSPYGEKCDPAEQKCVECLPLPEESTCAFGLYCDITKTCAIGCAEDGDCNPQGAGPLACDVTTHQCVGCSSDVPCPIGSKCEMATGACLPGCDATADCPTADWGCCLGQCRNIAKDEQHCGACEEPCLPDQSTTWLCLDGGCVFQSCLNGWGDCDQNLAEGNGCEVNTQSDPVHCGGCGDACSLPDAVEGCADGLCTIAGCQGGFADCDQKAATGCEVELAADVDHCGGCDQPCPAFDHGVAGCQGGDCVLLGCEPGFGNCDDNDANGCETSTESNAQHCGGCGDACQLDDAAASCQGGTCQIDTCDDGFQDCNGSPGDGCEVDTASDPAHCNGCGSACSYSNAAATCSNGACQLGVCLEGFENCNGLAVDGCEANTGTDEGNCGGCGVACGSANAVATCLGGMCQLQCALGWGDCDSLPGNGCETDLTSNVQHCDMCGNACPGDGGTPYCFMSQCGVSNCSPGTANCNGTPVDGCETDVTTAANCGACGNTCSSTNGAPSCNGTTCSITCNAGFGNCNGNVGDGCEQPLNTNMHCTACGVPCVRPHAFTSCASGAACLIVSCETGWSDCNMNPSDGCETNIDTSEGDCGGCGDVCAPPNAAGVCVNGACTIGSCNGTFENCNGSATDGCEVDTASSLAHCGGCGDVCSLPNATPACSQGLCQIQSCSPNFADCDMLHSTGCEVNTLSSLAHCGTCGNQCSSNHGAPSCAMGQCAINCDAGFESCNMSVADGCETPTTTLSSCGGCGVTCDLPHAAETCATGTCQIAACESGYNNCDAVASTGCECGGMCVGGVCQGCGDAACNAGAGETCSSCPADCGDCCGNGTCDGSFGENCMSCAADCGDCSPVCGDFTCDPGETCATCPTDCGQCCGDGICQPALGESCNTCSTDCGQCCGNSLCDAIFGEDCMTCPVDCSPCRPR